MTVLLTGSDQKTVQETGLHKAVWFAGFEQSA